MQNRLRSSQSLSYFSVMKQRYLFSALLLLGSLAAQAQQSKPVATKLGVGASFDYAVINNVKEVRGAYKPGFNMRLIYNPRPFFALSGEFTTHARHNSAPALDNITAWNADLNTHFIMQVGESDLKFAAILGVGMLDWKGTYVGPSLNDNNTYYYGLVLRDSWIAANMGFGFNHDFGKRFNGFGEFKVRMTSQGKDDLFGVRDAAFNFGVRFNFLEIQKQSDNRNGSTVKNGDTNAKGKTDKTRRRKIAGRKYNWLPK